MMKHTKKGAVTIEAAIVLPIFLIAVLTIGYLVNLAIAKESIITAVTDEARAISSEVYTSIIPAGVEHRLEQRIKQEGIFVTDFRVTDRKENPLTGDITIDCSYMVKNHLSIRLKGDFKQSVKVRFHGFTGRNNSGTIFSFDDMEKADDSATVWIFPDYGECYHRSECRYIKVNAHQMLLSDQLRGQYSPCRFCKPQKLGNGHLVYCFLTSGKAYHRGDCSQVDRYVISMTRGEAERKGYLPCTDCGGV